MKHAALVPILALLITSACAGNKPPAAPASHPSIADLTCPDEPDIIALLAADASGLQFDKSVREAGQACRDALARVCRWHKDRGADVTCPVPIKEPR
jgi:hypothetical protein